MNTQGLTRSSHFWGSISASLFRIQKSSRAPPTPPTIASKALITLIIHLLLSASHGAAGPIRGGCATSRGSRTHPAQLGRPAVVDVLQGLVEALLPADPGGHALPEAARSHGARPGVGAVEPGDGRPVGQLGDFLGGLVRVVVQVEAL